MTDRSLADLGWLRACDAAWWLGLLYRRPQQFREALDTLPLRSMLHVGVILSLHALVYTLFIAAFGRWILFHGLGVEFQSGAFQEDFLPTIHASLFGLGVLLGIAAGVAGGVTFGFAFGLSGGIAVWINGVVAIGVPSGIAFGISTGVLAGITVGIAFGISSTISVGVNAGNAIGAFGGIVLSAVLGVLVGIAATIDFNALSGAALGMISGAILGIVMAAFLGVVAGLSAAIGVGIAGAFGGAISAEFYGPGHGAGPGIATGTAAGIASAITLLRAYYYLPHAVFWLLAPGAIGYRLHPVSFDNMCSLQFIGIDRFLLAYRNVDPIQGEKEIERLILHYPSQRIEALKARASVIAEKASDAPLNQIDEIVNRLPGGDSGFLAQTPRVRGMVAEIAQTQRRLDTVDRPFLRQPYAEALYSRIEAFQGQVSGFREPLVSDFRAAAEAWRIRAKAELEDVKRIFEAEPTPQVFRAGDPVDRSQEAFVSRLSIAGQVERQLTLATGCPGILIYGRRRMGKSTLIRNLDAFVPESVRIINVSMQNPAAFTSTAHFTRLISQRLKAELGDSDEPAGEDLEGLYQRLNQVNEVLEGQDRRLVLAFDEFENIDQKIGEGVFPLDFLATLRESIQNHRRLIWVFAGSHHITELANAEWSSYLVSAQTIEIPPFSLVFS